MPLCPRFVVHSMPMFVLINYHVIITVIIIIVCHGHTHLVEDGEVAGHREDAGQDAVTEVSVSDVAGRTHTGNICTHAHTHTHTHTHTRTHPQAHTHRRTHTRTLTHTQTHTHMHTQTHTHAHTQTHTQYLSIF